MGPRALVGILIVALLSLAGCVNPKIEMCTVPNACNVHICEQDNACNAKPLELKP